MASFNGSNNHDLTDSQTEDATEDFEVNSKPFGPAVPHPPPDMPPDWEMYQQEPQSLETNGSTDTGNVPMKALLTDIRQGTQLRRVQVQERSTELRTSDGEFRDIRSELCSTLLSKRISHMHKSRDKLVELSEETTALKTAVLTAQRCGHKFAQLSALMQELNTFQSMVKEENIPEEALVSQFDWPVSMICTLSNIVKEMAAFKSDLETCLQQEHAIKVGNTQLSHARLISSLSKLNTSSCAINTEGAFSSMISYFSIDRGELEQMVEKARIVAIVLLSELIDKSLIIYATSLESGLNRIEQNIRVKSGFLALGQIADLCRGLENSLNVPRHPKFQNLNLNLGDLRELHLSLGTQGPQGKPGPTQVKDVSLQNTRTNPPPVSLRPKRLSALQERNKGVTDEIIEVMTRGDTSALAGLLEKSLLPSIYTLCEPTLAYECMRSGSIEVLDVALAHREKALQSAEVVVRKDYCWMFEAYNQREIEMLAHLINKQNMKIDTGPINKEGNTLFLTATRKFDYQMMIQLLELGANPIILTEANTTALHYLAMKKFATGSGKEVAAKIGFGCLDFSSYLNNESLSDVILIASDGKRFHAHKLLLCAQSPVFKSMLESGLWEQKQNNEHTFPTIRSQVLSHVLTYLYTGDLIYPHDDLTLGVELLSSAQQFLIERMQGEMETILARKIDNEVVLELYQAALSFGANYLFNKCCYHLLMNYSHISDPNHACLQHLFSLKKEEESCLSSF